MAAGAVAAQAGHLDGQAHATAAPAAKARADALAQEALRLRALLAAGEYQQLVGQAERSLAGLAESGGLRALGPEGRVAAVRILRYQAIGYQMMGLHLSAAYTLRRAFDLAYDAAFADDALQLAVARDLADEWRFAGNAEEAEVMYRRTLAITGGREGPMRREHARNLAAYARFLIDQRRFSAAEPLLVQARRHLAAVGRGGATLDEQREVLRLLSIAYLGLGRPEQALTAAWAGYEAIRAALGEDSRDAVIALYEFGRLEQRIGNTASAAVHLQLAREKAMAIGLDSERIGRIDLALAELPEEARRLAENRSSPVLGAIQTVAGTREDEAATARAPAPKRLAAPVSYRE